jgi:hypothetical protein
LTGRAPKQYRRGDHGATRPRPDYTIEHPVGDWALRLWKSMVGVGRLRAADRILVLIVVACMTVGLSSCGGTKTYDISPIFPLSSGKCAHYGGHEEGSGVLVTCMVTKAECEKAAADWRRAMQAGDVTEAIEFSCE